MNDVNLSDKAPHEYFVQQLRADYKDNMLTEAVSNALKTLPEEKQKEFIAKARGPWPKRTAPRRNGFQGSNSGIPGG